MECLAHEVMREPVAAEDACDGREQAGMDRLVDRIQGVVAVQVADPAQDVDAELRTDGGAENEGASGFLAEVADPPRDHRPDPGRHGNAERGQVTDVQETTLG